MWHVKWNVTHGWFRIREDYCSILHSNNNNTWTCPLCREMRKHFKVFCKTAFAVRTFTHSLCLTSPMASVILVIVLAFLPRVSCRIMRASFNNGIMVHSVKILELWSSVYIVAESLLVTQPLNKISLKK